MSEQTQKQKLDDNIPHEAVVTREAWRNGPTLSYLTGAYVIKRLNDVLGQGSWGYRIADMMCVFEGTIQQAKGEAFTTSYISRISLWAIVDGKNTTFEEVGYGDGTDLKSKGKTHELATKESVTDGLKRAAKNLGISLGLGLYFKSGEYIDEANTKTELSKREEIKELLKKSVPANEGRPSSGHTQPTHSSSQGNTKELSAKVLKEQIKSSFAVLQAQKKISKEVFVKDYLNGARADDLSDDSAKTVLEKIKINFPELGL